MLCGVRQANALQRRRSGGENTARLGLIFVFEHTDGLKLSKYFTKKQLTATRQNLAKNGRFGGLENPWGASLKERLSKIILIIAQTP